MLKNNIFKLEKWKLYKVVILIHASMLVITFLRVARFWLQVIIYKSNMRNDELLYKIWLLKR